MAMHFSSQFQSLYDDKIFDRVALRTVEMYEGSVSLFEFMFYRNQLDSEQKCSRNFERQKKKRKRKRKNRPQLKTQFQKVLYNNSMYAESNFGVNETRALQIFFIFKGFLQEKCNCDSTLSSTHEVVILSACKHRNYKSTTNILVSFFQSHGHHLKKILFILHFLEWKCYFSSTYYGNNFTSKKKFRLYIVTVEFCATNAGI